MRPQAILLTASFLLSACDSSQVNQEQLKKEIDSFLKEYEAGMVFVEGGTFVMGDQDKEWKEKNPQYRIRRQKHTVTLSDFYIHKFETPNKYFNLYLKATQKSRKEDYTHKDDNKPNYPATSLTWYEANAFCQWVGSLTGKNYRLPTEAEWEYAARSRGKDYQYGTKGGTFEPGVNTNKKNTSYTEPVDAFLPNDIGLYHMQGNVKEWVNDWYSDSYFANSPKLDPEGPLLDANAEGDKVCRSYGFSTEKVTVYERIFCDPSVSSIKGFRCVRGHRLSTQTH